MEEKDIRTYLKARTQGRRRKIATLFAILTIVLYVVLRIYGFNSIYINAVALGAFLGSVILNSDLFGWGNVTRGELLSIIERQISKDPEALKSISQKDAS